jgi:hypothetical protein
MVENVRRCIADIVAVGIELLLPKVRGAFAITGGCLSLDHKAQCLA